MWQKKIDLYIHHKLRVSPENLQVLNKISKRQSSHQIYIWLKIFEMLEFLQLSGSGRLLAYMRTIDGFACPYKSVWKIIKLANSVWNSAKGVFFRCKSFLFKLGCYRYIYSKRNARIRKSKTCVHFNFSRLSKVPKEVWVCAPALWQIFGQSLRGIFRKPFYAIAWFLLGNKSLKKILRSRFRRVTLLSNGLRTIDYLGQSPLTVARRLGAFEIN